MAFEIKRYPEWSFSQSREQMFQECLRKYYYHYYASHNGWLVELATPLQMKAYRLKQMTNLYLLFGTAVHRACEHVIDQWVTHNVLPTLTTLHDGVRLMLNRAYVQSLDQQLWKKQPKRQNMLVEMYYDGGIRQEKIDRIKERQHSCLENLLASRTLSELTKSNEMKVVEREKMNTMLVDETKVYVKIDLLYRRDWENVVIVDWKTGRVNGSDDEQLFLYALYVHENYSVPFENMELRTEYLLSGKSRSIDVTAQQIEEVKDHIKQSVAEMKGLLADEYWNRPKEMSQFTPQPSQRTCRYCNFREICDDAI
ncbi:RecB family exonuclease [Numidum massiliense]|uniref:RecB family exonuclease n=1 Tax=Numidum massiliense TaxID=1522315 RepID=UPI0006D584A3|nr:PD-(D/E)XK nuclease family protein [Numidum massiliense]